MESVYSRAEQKGLARKYKIETSFPKLITLEQKQNKENCFQTSWALT